MTARKAWLGPAWSRWQKFKAWLPHKASEKQRVQVRLNCSIPATLPPARLYQLEVTAHPTSWRPSAQTPVSVRGIPQPGHCTWQNSTKKTKQRSGSEGLSCPISFPREKIFLKNDRVKGKRVGGEIQKLQWCPRQSPWLFWTKWHFTTHKKFGGLVWINNINKSVFSYAILKFGILVQQNYTYDDDV